MIFEIKHHPKRESLRVRQAPSFVSRMSTFLAKFFRSLPTLSNKIKVPKTFTGSLVQARSRSLLRLDFQGSNHKACVLDLFK